MTVAGPIGDFCAEIMWPFCVLQNEKRERRMKFNSIDPNRIFWSVCPILSILMAEGRKAAKATAGIINIIGLPKEGNICLECGETSLCRVRRAG